MCVIVVRILTNALSDEFATHNTISLVRNSTPSTEKNTVMNYWHWAPTIRDGQALLWQA